MQICFLRTMKPGMPQKKWSVTIAQATSRNTSITFSRLVAKLSELTKVALQYGTNQLNLNTSGSSSFVRCLLIPCRLWIPMFRMLSGFAFRLTIFSNFPADRTVTGAKSGGKTGRPPPPGRESSGELPPNNRIFQERFLCKL